MKTFLIRASTQLLLAWALVFTAIDAGAQAEGAAEAEEAKDAEKAPAMFGASYPVRFARRPLVLHEGMVRADARVTVGGVFGPGTFSSLDIRCKTNYI